MLRATQAASASPAANHGSRDGRRRARGGLSDRRYDRSRSRRGRRRDDRGMLRLEGREDEHALLRRLGGPMRHL